MSIPSSPLSPAHLEQDSVSPLRSHSTPSRTVAIIKNHALVHRLDIEPRISEAGFEIVKERQMEFDMETDPEVMFELFGEEAECFSEGPVWVYVLERKRAVEVWKTLMGDRDPEVARELAPNSLRAIYGRSLLQNGLMGSPDLESAEIQIASLFASSPPYPVTDLPDITPGGTMRSMSSSILAELRESGTSEGGYAPSNPSTVGGQSNRRSSFKARPVPASIAKPDIIPRTTRAASLRAGVPVEKVYVGARPPLSKEALARTFANVPGHKRSETIKVASTAPPVVAPRMTRAASLRLGQIPPPRPARTSTSEGSARLSLSASGPPKSAGFDGVPGHKRRETFSVASTKAPTVAPRTNKSAALRLQKDNAPPSSWGARAAQPTLSRASSSTSLNGSNARTPARPASASAVRPATTARPPSVTKAPAAQTAPDADRRPKPRASSISTPSIEPRTNKSAALRAAKMALTNASNANTKRVVPFF